MEPQRPVGPDPGGTQCRVVLVYPETYAIGMSNLGVHAALRAFRETAGVSCERAFWPGGSGRVDCDGFLGVAPADDPADRLLSTAGRALESGDALKRFDVVAFSMSFEGDAFNLVRMLAGGGIPPLSKDRAEDDPIVVLGGVCAHLNPAPLAPFIDAFLVGDAFALAGPASEALGRGRTGERAARAARLRRLAELPGAYVPAVPPGEPVSPASWSGRWAESVVVSPDTCFSDMYLIEIARGCPRRCRFCAAGESYAPVAYRPAGDVVARVGEALRYTRRVGLVSAALGDHPEIVPILEAMAAREIELSVSSLRADAVTPEIARLLMRSGVRTVTIAPEAGSEELRRRMGKPIDDEALLAAAETLAGCDATRVRAYFMTGLPGARDDESEAVVDLSMRLQSVLRPRGARLSVSLSPFVPKPRTVLQWAPMAPEREHRRAIATIRRSLVPRGIDVTSAGAREAAREAALARGGAELAPAILMTALEGIPWKAAARRTGVDLDRLVTSERGPDEPFPWEVVRVGREREALRRDYELLS